MPRLARVVVPGLPHHITHRGIRRSDVFWDDKDRLRYLDLFRFATAAFLLRIWSFCLMDNHVHFVAVPGRTDSIGKAFHWVNTNYDQYFNRKYGLTGNLWEGRPRSSVCDERHSFAAVRYVERNPVRARMVANATDFRWSSARIRCGLAYDSILDLSWPPKGAIPSWEAWLADAGDEQLEDLIRKNTYTGRPCGDDSFVRNIEMAINRNFSRGNPRRKPNG